jgi:molybdopterin converting factor small subunit
VTVHIPGALHSYTGRRSEVDVEGGTLGEVLASLDQRYPGLRFRIVTEQGTIRPHIRIFVNDTQVQALGTLLQSDDEIHIILALSGG